MTAGKAQFTSVEICAGAGGQAVGLHGAGFRHRALIEIDKHAIATLTANVELHGWKDCRVLERDLREFKSSELDLEEGDLDLLAGGVPCPPFSLAGKQLGPADERDLFPEMLRLVDELKPKSVMIENVRGLLEPPEKFRKYREEKIETRLKDAGYEICMWEVLEARDYGVPQLRPRAILVAMLPEYAKHFKKPKPKKMKKFTVGAALQESMHKRFEDHGAAGWEKLYDKWLGKASKDIAPTLVGGSKKHGGADLGPTRAKKAWADLGVNGLGVANDPENCNAERDLYGDTGPMLTVSQAAIIQGFPTDWKFQGRKTARYRQVGNAFPPPVAEAVGLQIAAALDVGGARAVKDEAAMLFSVLQSSQNSSGSELAHSNSDLKSAVAG